MNYAEPRCRVYDPDALNMMGRAFDEAVKGLSPEAKADPNIHQNLARCILQLFDEGERSSLHLAIIALSIVDGRWHVSKERIAPFYRIGALIPSGIDRQLGCLTTARPWSPLRPGIPPLAASGVAYAPCPTASARMFVSTSCNQFAESGR
jgi:hypothetical protein